MKKSTIIITPVYSETITKNELLTVRSTQKYLSEYKRVIIAPKKFSKNDEFIKKWNSYGYEVSFFDNKYFKNVQAHNQFMMNPKFYKFFDNFEYMLIVQLDVLIFSNSLHYWLDKDIDYMGAPWVTKNFYGTYLDKAGNGGLSLRRIPTFIKVLESKKLFNKREHMSILSCQIPIKYIFLIKVLSKLNFLSLSPKFFRFMFKANEDRFWALFAPFFTEKYNVASIEDSLAFAFERYPEFCFKQNNFSFPFGVHAWDKYNPDFWRRHKASIFLEEHLQQKLSTPSTESVE